MRRRWLIRVGLVVWLILALGEFTALAGCLQARGAQPQPQARTGVTIHSGIYHDVMFLGDSLTAAWANDGAHAYPVLTINGLYLQNSGNAWYQLVKGRTGAQASGALLDLQTFAVQPHNVDLMVVELGTNDMTHMAASQFQANYQALVSYLLAGSPNALLVCLGPWRASTDNFGYDTEPAYAAVIQSVCQTSSAGALYVDLSALYANPAYHASSGDTFHPNDDGAQAIANAIVSAVYPGSGVL